MSKKLKLVRFIVEDGSNMYENPIHFLVVEVVDGEFEDAVSVYAEQWYSMNDSEKEKLEEEEGIENIWDYVRRKVDEDFPLVVEVDYRDVIV